MDLEELLGDWKEFETTCPVCKKSSRIMTTAWVIEATKGELLCTSCLKILGALPESTDN